MQPLQYAAGVVNKPALKAAVAGLGRWFVEGCAVLPICEDFQRRSQRSATTAHRALPVTEWPVLYIYHESLQCQMQTLQCAAGVVGPALRAVAGLGSWVVGVAFCAVVLWRFPEEDAAVGNHSAQSPASV